MSSFLSLYTAIVWSPLFNGLIWLYAVIPVNDFGIAIIAFTFVLRVLLLPLHWKAKKAQQNLSALQPEVKKIQEKFKNDREGQGKALMALYSERKVNPFSGCFPILIQLPILFALFQIFQSGFDPALLSYLYSFVPNPGTVNPVAFGFLDLSKGNVALGFFAALTQYIQTKISLPPPAPPSDKPDFSQILQKQSLYMIPLMLLFFSYSFPAAVTLYWTMLNIFGILQDTAIARLTKKAP